MRGVVEFEWRDEVGSARRSRHARPTGPAGPSAWRVVRERTLLTETGMQGVQGGDPAGTSKAMCLIW